MQGLFKKTCKNMLPDPGVSSNDERLAPVKQTQLMTPLII